jgi:hypothetical protein
VIVGLMVTLLGMGGPVTIAQIQDWAAGLAGLHARFMSRFAHSEPRAQALAYPRGLMAPLERTNGWTQAEQAGQARPDGMQQLLNTADWDIDAVGDDVGDFVIESLGAPQAVLIGDDTGFVTKGSGLGRRATAGHRDRGHEGQLSDRDILGLRLGAGPGVDRPGVVPGGLLDR